MWPFLPFQSPRNRKGRRKRRRVWRIAEFQPSAKKTHVSIWLHIVLPPCRVCTGRQESYNQCAKFCRFVCFAYPAVDLTTVRRIHKHTMSAPILSEAILLYSEMISTCCIVMCAARVQCEAKKSVQAIKKILRCCPFVGSTGKHDGIVHNNYFICTTSDGLFS